MYSGTPAAVDGPCTPEAVPAEAGGAVDSLGVKVTVASVSSTNPSVLGEYSHDHFDSPVSIMPRIQRDITTDDISPMASSDLLPPPPPVDSLSERPSSSGPDLRRTPEDRERRLSVKREG